MDHRPLTAAARERVVGAIRAGNTIEAIRLYRQDTLASLRDAKDAVDGMAAGQPEPAVSDPVSGAAADGAVLRALYAGRKIEAIKQYRLEHRVDLRTAKDAVEAIDADQRRATPERFAGPAATGGCGGGIVALLLVLAVIAAVAWHFFR